MCSVTVIGIFNHLYTRFINSKSAKTKTQWLGFWGGDDGAYCAFPDTLASLEEHAAISIPICPP